MSKLQIRHSAVPASSPLGKAEGNSWRGLAEGGKASGLASGFSARQAGIYDNKEIE